LDTPRPTEGEAPGSLPEEAPGSGDFAAELGGEEPAQEPPPQQIVGYKRPESVLVVVYTMGGDFLLLRRTKPDGFWQSVTGSLRAGESPRRTALRELKEETGLVISPSALMDLRHSERFPILPAWRSRYAPSVHYNLEHWFAVQLPGRRLIRLTATEHREHRWLSLDRAAARASSWTNRNAIIALGGMAGFGCFSPPASSLRSPT
jgi:dATP pyrophosphohydrolase